MPTQHLTTTIAGHRYRDGATAALAEMDPGEPLTLVRAPDNPYDTNAIEVWSDTGIHLGYIPKAQNAPLAKIMDTGDPIGAAFAGLQEAGTPTIDLEWHADVDQAPLNSSSQ